jgi:hypothetical protein
MDHRDRHQGGYDQGSRRRPDSDEPRGGGRPPEDARFGQGGQSGQAGYGDSNYAQGRLSQSSGRGPQALGQSGNLRSHEDNGGYAGGWQGGQGPGGYGYGYGFGAPEGSGGHDQGGGRARGGGQGGDIGFGEGGAFQQGWGGQSDHQRREIGHEGHSGGSYAQGDYAQSARRSQNRDDQHYAGGLHQDQGGQGGYSGHDASPGHDHEPDLCALEEKPARRAGPGAPGAAHRAGEGVGRALRPVPRAQRSRFHNEFEDWRSQQRAQNPGDGKRELMAQGSSGGSTGGNISGGADLENERDKSLSSPGGSLATDRTGVGDLTPADTANGGGAGMKGRGAVGGSSATMAANTAGPARPTPRRARATRA